MQKFAVIAEMSTKVAGGTFYTHPVGRNSFAFILLTTAAQRVRD